MNTKFLLPRMNAEATYQEVKWVVAIILHSKVIHNFLAVLLRWNSHAKHFPNLKYTIQRPLVY